MGSRFFTVSNGAGAVTAGAAPVGRGFSPAGFAPVGRGFSPAGTDPAGDTAEATALRGRRGYNLAAPLERIEAGVLHGEELDRFEVHFVPGPIRISAAMTVAEPGGGGSGRAPAREPLTDT